MGRETLSRAFEEKNGAVFSYDIHYPVIGCENETYTRYVNGYGKDAARMLAKELEKERKADKTPRTLFFWRRIQAPCNHNGILSLLATDHRREGFSGPRQLRLSADNWDLNKGRYLTLPRLFKPGCGWRRMLLGYIIRQMSVREKQEEQYYQDRHLAIARDAFDPDHFYLTPEGVAVFYQPGILCAEEKGPQVFTVPYRLLNGHLKIKP